MERWIPHCKKDLEEIVSWKLKTIKHITFTSHAQKRMKSKRISCRQINELIHNFILLDCNNREGDLRVVLESITKYNGKTIVAIISLISGELITCYKSDKRNHAIELDNIPEDIAISLVS